MCRLLSHNNGKNMLGKFDAINGEGILLGYSSYRKWYKVQNKLLMCVEERVHVVLDETNVIANQVYSRWTIKIVCQNEQEQVNKQGSSPAHEVNIALYHGKN